VRKEEDLRRQSGERLSRSEFKPSEDEYHELNEYAVGRLGQMGQSWYDCGKLEVIDTVECMQSQLEHGESSSCEVSFVKSALSALRVEMVPIAETN
jgi:hypothetical protein